MKKNKRGKGKKREKSKSKFQDPVLESFQKSPDRALNYKQIAKRIGVTDKQEKNQLAQALHQMKTDGLLREVDRGKYRLKHIPKPKLVGKVDLTASGAAYVTVDEFDRDVYISPRKVRKALPGDTVKLHAYANRKGSRIEGEIVEVIERARDTFVGKISTSRQFAFMVPDNQKIPVDFFIPLEKLMGAKDGDKVIVKMTGWPERAHNPFGEVISVLGRPGDMQTEMHSILAEFDFPLHFPENVEAEADAIPENISKEEIAKRRDFRHITTFTIDPDDAKDFDDALSLRKLDNGN